MNKYEIGARVRVKSSNEVGTVMIHAHDGNWLTLDDRGRQMFRFDESLEPANELKRWDEPPAPDPLD